MVFSNCLLSFSNVSLKFMKCISLWLSHCISLVTKCFEHLFMYLLDMYSFLGEMSIQIIYPFLIGIFAFLFLSSKSPLYILDNRLIGFMIYKYFLPFWGVFFHFFDHMFWIKKSCKILVKFNLFILPLVLLVSCIRNYCLTQSHENLLLCSCLFFFFNECVSRSFKKLSVSILSYGF